MRVPIILLEGAAIVGGLYGVFALRRMAIRGASLARTLDSVDEAPAVESEEKGRLGEWLDLAGYRSRGAEKTFIGLTAGMFASGLSTVLLLKASGLVDTGIRALEGMPGAIGEIFLPILYVGPWIVMLILASLPWTVVRSSRRKLIAAVEQDLPLVLELLATLGEAGLGFDAAIARIIASQSAVRPLLAELRAFQRETLTGRPRVQALRRLAKRLDVPSLTIFISAIVMAEQVGSGVADVLRRQADDARDRRRDRALTQAQTLPVKMLFPLVICFLPAIFVMTLGPIFLQFFQIAEAIMGKQSPQ